MATKGSHIVTVAIDFGTTYSGYAYSFKSDYRNDPGKISCNAGLSNDSMSYKTPTVILLKFPKDRRTFEVVACGSSAEQIYLDLEEDDKRQYEFVDRFKMKLYSDSAAMDIREDSKLTLSNGKTIQVLRLFSIFIEYLKEHFYGVTEKRGLMLKESEIKWVLTVPAIWTDGAKQFMRKAAEMAGVDDSQLTIALEPEAAALSCVQLLDPTDTDRKKMIKTGTKFLVIDAGGGTVDYTILKKLDGNRIDIIQEASGGPWGGTSVDNRFFDVLEETFGTDVFEEFENNKPGDFLELRKEFERKKKDVSTTESSMSTMKIPLSFSDVYEETKQMSIGNAESKYGEKVRVARDKLRIDSILLKSVFDESCANIILHTQDILRGSGNVSAILLVGGFGDSNVLRERMKEAFSSHKIITPEDPSLSVLKGAVLYGHDPQLVKSRIAKYTYGTDTCVTFIEGSHPDEKKKVYDGIERCTDIFAIHVKKGQKLEAGKAQTRESYAPLCNKQTSMSFKIYASTEKKPLYVTDDSCKYIGDLTIDIPDTTKGKDRDIFVEMSFGETEMDVKATDDTTGKTMSVRLNFLD